MKKFTILLTMVLLVSLLACDDTDDNDTSNPTLTSNTFDDLTLASGSFWNGSDESGGFTSEGVYFFNAYDATWGSWDGWAYSNMTDTTTPGYANQYSAITGRGYNSHNYGVCYYASWDNNTQIHIGGDSAGESATIQGLYLTNTTYAYLAMLNGASPAKIFGGDDGNDADWFLLTIYALDDSYARTSDTVEFYLADYRYTDNTQDYIISSWTWVDLSSLGDVYGLEFELTSSDNDPSFGMNTPAYFAMDGLKLDDSE